MVLRFVGLDELPKSIQPVLRSVCTVTSPDANRVRVRWQLAYLAEDGSLTSSEGTRPADESVTIREIISKVDLNRDGVLAAASARKLDKGGYSLQDRAPARNPPPIWALTQP